MKIKTIVLPIVSVILSACGEVNTSGSMNNSSNDPSPSSSSIISTSSSSLSSLSSISSSSSTPSYPMNVDGKGLLRSLHDNETYQRYVNNQIGDPVIIETGTGNNETVNEPIVVPPGAVFDGKNKTYKPGSKLGGGSQDENQMPVFILTPGASLINTVIGSPGAEGVHMMGDNTLDNVHWDNVGEDAASVRSYFPGGKITIMNGSAKDASDKVFQFNAPCDVTIKNFTATNMGKLVRQNGGTSFKLNITLENVTAKNISDAAIRSDSKDCTVRERNFKVSNGKKYKGNCKTSSF